MSEIIPNLNLNYISICKINRIFGEQNDDFDDVQKAQFQAEVMQLGYILSEPALQRVNLQNYQDILRSLKKLTGRELTFEPFYPNFPQQTIDTPKLQLFINSFLHYLTFGNWKPEYDKTERLPVFESTQFKVLEIASSQDIAQIYSSLIHSTIAIAEQDQQFLAFLIDYLPEDELVKLTPVPIPFRENKAILVSSAFRLGKMSLISNQIQTATDILRIATAFSNGDISLATNTKFKLKQGERKFIVRELEKVITQDEIAKQQNKWVRLFHCLHISTFQNAPKCKEIAELVRNQKISNQYNSKIEKAILQNDLVPILECLSYNPGDGIRRLDKIFRNLSDLNIEESVFKILSQKNISTRVLIQAYNHFKNRSKKRLILPKSLSHQTLVLAPSPGEVKVFVQDSLLSIIKDKLRDQNDKLVYIDKSLKQIPIPTSMRNASPGMMALPSGSKLSIGDPSKQVLRFFVWWTAPKDDTHSDLDLSSVMLDDGFNFVSHVAYTNLKNEFAFHSGDIVSVTKSDDGACEFIDVDLWAVPKGVKYITLDVRRYGGNIINAFAGWMLREKLGNYGEIFNPKTVINTVQMSEKSGNLTTCLFDTQNYEMIWMDVQTPVNNRKPNALLNNIATIQDVSEKIATSQYLSVYDLLEMKYQNRTDIKDKADLVFDLSILKDFQKVIDLIS